MIGIVDSGSTKTEWCFINESGEEKRILTCGLNPYFVNSDTMKECLEKEIYPFIDNRKVKQLFFFGSGCAQAEMRLILNNPLEDFFPCADIQVESDLLGASLALCGTQAGLVAVLGTGSSTCFFDGTQITERLPSLGFVLGDEGSGARIGISLLSDYLNERMPENLRKFFALRYPISIPEILNHIYKKESPNRFLGEFASFATDYLSDPYIENLLKGAFDSFFQKQVLRYPQVKEYPLYIIGSTAYYGRRIIEEIASCYQIKIAKIEQSPMAGLLKYYQSTLAESSPFTEDM
ncbi:MAG: hypothetical protein RRX93_08390 [Bacteroidales bacterium]